MVNPELTSTNNTETEVKEGWIVETESLKSGVLDFLSANMNRDSSSRGYDSNELQYSGGVRENFTALRDKSAEIRRVNVLYQKGTITQIHVVVDSRDKDGKLRESGYLDVYLTKKALADFLKTI
jgi:hypothetical protein